MPLTLKPKIEQIRTALLARRGGLDGASDAQLRRIWGALDPADRARYLEQEPTCLSAGRTQRTGASERKAKG